MLPSSFLCMVICTSVHFLVPWGGVKLNPLGTSVIIWHQPRTIDGDDDDDRGAVGGMNACMFAIFKTV
jgi:hypothetical protein